MSKNVIACFYDTVGDAVTSYQIFNSLGDFYRSVVKAAYDKSLPFYQFSSDYTVSIVGFLDNGKFLPCSETSKYTFAQIQAAGEGMDPNVNFNTSLFVSRLSEVL
uniref:Nonstructural protein n=1 Tax=Dulem virus 89 TaxID=3145800 RepID=A0AAU8B260_9VIRU